MAHFPATTARHLVDFAARSALSWIVLFALGAGASSAARPEQTFYSAWLGETPIFEDGFESSSTCPWSVVAPPDSPNCANAEIDVCETDVDCGGRDCPGCANSQSCLVDSDCLSGICSLLTCVECVVPSTCPGEDTECQSRTCIANACGLIFEDTGTVITDQVPGDCRVRVCDGSGGIISVPDDADLPDDGIQCTQNLCSAGTPSFPPEPEGTPCNQNGGSSCDGFGNCVVP